jgi:hypothetical protein
LHYYPTVEFRNRKIAATVVAYPNASWAFG